MTVNAAWNIWNFRRPLVEAMAGPVDTRGERLVPSPAVFALACERGRLPGDRDKTPVLLRQVLSLLQEHSDMPEAEKGDLLGECDLIMSFLCYNDITEMSRLHRPVARAWSGLSRRMRCR